eukprot:jgi/Chlat1/4647/Chrsp3S00435
MRVTVSVADDERVVALDVDGSTVADDVKAILEAETDIPMAQQRLVFNGREVRDGATMAAAGVGEGDLILLVRQQQQQQQASQQPANNPTAINADGSAVNPAAFQQFLHSQPQLMAQLRQNAPELADAVTAGNLDSMQRLLRLAHEQRNRRAQLERELLTADPFDVEAQRRIEQQIQQQNIEENLSAAYEHTPEAFASVHMLYVDIEVNGRPLKAFVDSGAQMTIMSETCAEKCGVMRLVDKRFQGVAVGVGTSKIVGRVHLAQVKIGSLHIPCSFTVLEGDQPEFLFGLDMLKKHQCSIDLKQNLLIIQSGDGVVVPFLGEGEIPKSIRNHIPDPASDAQKAAASSQGQIAPAPASIPNVPSAPPTQPQQQQASSSNQEYEKIARLMALGFDRGAAQQALRACNGNEEHAASLLFDGGC